MFKLFTKRKKFSKENLVHQCTLLEKNPKINPRNKQLVIETLRQIAELMIWGDQNDDSFFNIIAERNILGYFLKIIEQNYHRSVTIQVMQTLSIMIQNISKQQSLYYLFSNNYINDLVVHQFDSSDNEILAYYISFLKTISLKLDENVINFFFNAKAHDFPLYSEALKFFKNEDQMVRIAVRTLTLNVFGVDDPDLRKFITDKSAVPYFSNLTWFIRDQCIVLNETLNKAIYGQKQQQQTVETEKKSDEDDKPSSSPSTSSSKRDRSPSFIDKVKKNKKKPPVSSPPTVTNKTPTNQLQRGVEEQVDHYYYLEDIFLLGLRPLSDKLMNQLLSHLVLPVLVGSLVDVDDLVKVQQDILNQYNQEMSNIDHEQSVEPMMNTQPTDDNNEEHKAELNKSNDANKSTSMLEMADDDTQKASAIRKFLERRTRISKQLSLFLLTQVLTVFSDGGLINAIIVALMHPEPPKLVNQIVLNPPSHAVEPSIPITHIICRRRSYYRKNSTASTSQPSTPINENMDEEKQDKRSKLMQRILENDENGKIHRSRIESVEKVDIITEDSNLPEDTNMYRNELLNMLNSDPTETENEQLIASAAALILTIIRNKSTSEDLLVAAGICPQKRKRKREFFGQQPLKSSSTDKSSYATPSSQPDRHELLPEHEATLPQQLEIKTSIKREMMRESKQEMEENNLSKAETKSLPDLSQSNKPNIPLPSPKLPSAPSMNHNNNNNQSQHGKSDSLTSLKNMSFPVPLTSALPSPNKLLYSNSPRAKSQPPITQYTEPQRNGYHHHALQRSSSLNKLPNDVVMNGIGSDSEAEQKGNGNNVDSPRRKSDGDISKISSKDGTVVQRLSGTHEDNTPKKVKNGLTVDTEIKLSSPTANAMLNPLIKSGNDQLCDYPFEFVECIINVLSQCSKLSVFTIRVLSELLIDFVQDRTMKNNGLNEKHYNSLLSVWSSVKSQVAEYLPLQSAAMETYFIDTFEEEWRSVRQQPRISTLIANPIRILPPHVFHGSSPKKDTSSKPKTSTNSIPPNDKKKSDGDKSDTQPSNSQSEGKESNRVDRMIQDQQQLIRKLERIRKSIHNFLHISRLKTELLGGSVGLPFVPRTEFQYYYRLQVPLSTIAPGCLNCLVLMQSQKRRRVLFSIREPDWLLLFNRMKGRAGFAMIYMAIPIHSIEGVLNKLDPRVVHLSIRSPVRPHDAAIPISSQKNKWSITLFFDSMFAATRPNKNGNNGNNANKEPEVGHKDALTALDYITMNRMRVRRKMMTQISQLVAKGNTDSIDNDMNSNHSNHEEEDIVTKNGMDKDTKIIHTNDQIVNGH